MRFKRHQRIPFTDTPRKRAALARKQRLEREALPLFADAIAAAQPAPDQVMAERAERFARAEADRRQWLARRWRQGRRQLAAYPDDIQRRLRAYWQTCPWPADPTYLLSMLHMFDTGRLDLPEDSSVHA